MVRDRTKQFCWQMHSRCTRKNCVPTSQRERAQMQKGFNEHGKMHKFHYWNMDECTFASLEFDAQSTRQLKSLFRIENWELRIERMHAKLNGWKQKQQQQKSEPHFAKFSISLEHQRSNYLSDWPTIFADHSIFIL